MTVKEMAYDLVALCCELRFSEAVDRHYSPEIVSVETVGDPRETQGIDAVRAKAAWFDQTFETLSCRTEGPWINEPCFIVKFSITVRNRETGEETTMDELALYSVHDGKIVHERFL
jgi:hypothetical protein